MNLMYYKSGFLKNIDIKTPKLWDFFRFLSSKMLFLRLALYILHHS